MAARIQDAVGPYVSLAGNFIRRMVAPSQEPSSTICITRQEKGPFSGGTVVRIDHDSLSSVLLRDGVRDKPIAVISIVGLMRTGKSFLMNFILRYLENSGWENKEWIGGDYVGVGTNGTVWRGGRERVTRGIQLLWKIFTIPTADGKLMNVLLVDTQGLFDHKTPERVNKVLLTLSTLMSSVQIFNSVKQIDSSQLRYLKTCVDYAQETARSQSRSHYLKLQNLVFLIRDSVDDAEFGFDGSTYLKSVLNETEGDDELVDVRKRIKESFENVSCFFIDHPGFDAEKNTFRGINKEIRSEFLNSVKRFVEYLMDPSNIHPKCSNERPLTGKELLNMITSFDTIFAENKFDPEQIMEANAKAFYAAESENIYSDFTKKIEDQMDAISTIEDLDKIYYKLESEAHQKFTNTPLIGKGMQKNEFANHLVEQCKRYRDIVEERVRLRQVRKKLKMQKERRKAFHTYTSETQNFVAKLDKSAAELRDFSSSKSSQISQEFADKLDQKEFDAQVKLWFENFSLKYEESRKGKEIAEQKESEGVVFRKVKKLQSEAEGTWRKHLQIVRDEEDLKEKAKQIHSEILNYTTGKYWKSVLSDKEGKYKQKLLGRLEQVQIGGYIPPSTEALDEDSLNYRIENIVKEFGKERKSKINAGVQITKKVQKEMWKLSLTTFYKLCSEHYITYSSKLDQLLQDASIEAQKINDRNLRDWKESFTAEVDGLLNDGEQKLQKEMKDKYLGDNVLGDYYKSAKDDLQNKFKNSTDGKPACKEQRLYFQVQLSKLERVYDVIKSNNEKNKWLKPVHIVKSWCQIL